MSYLLGSFNVTEFSVFLDFYIFNLIQSQTLHEKSQECINPYDHSTFVRCIRNSFSLLNFSIAILTATFIASAKE